MVTVMVNDGITGFILELDWDIEEVKDELDYAFGSVEVERYEIESSYEMLGGESP